MKEKITVEVSVKAPVTKVWEYFTIPEHILKWNQASDDWHTTMTANDVRVGGTFTYRMEAKDKSAGFDFGGTYTEIVPQVRMAYTMGEHEGTRKVEVDFKEENGMTTVTEVFDAENENSLEKQRAGWQAILENFKKHVETA